MLKLHVFLVDTGIMYTFDMEMALESVSRLMEAVAEVTQIPVSKQVLLIANGEPLNPSSRVGSYKSAGTETNPIFLFSKSAIESPQPPMSNSTITSELSLEQQVERCLQMPPTIDTLVARAILASEFHLSARELGETCDYLVTDQQLQQQGWQAVVLNLENITLALNKHAIVFKEHYIKFLSIREQYLDMFDRFDDVIMLLSRIPILPCLTRSESDSEPHKLCLLDWINSKEHKTSLQTLVNQCKELLIQFRNVLLDIMSDQKLIRFSEKFYHHLHKFDENVLENLMNEINKVLDSSDNTSMKEIKGLDERLISLQQRLILAKQFVQDQADMAQGFKQNQLRLEHIGDTSVLPDLCASHRKQLLVLLKNHKQLRDICTLCTKAKDELSANLHTRLRWVMYVEHSICKCDNKLLVFHESLKKMKRRLEVLEQVFEAPRMYVLAVLEILRRKSFSCQFLEWGRSVSLSSSEAQSDETEKRNKFSQVFGNHFLHSLFAGLDDMPPPFADSPPRIFDEILPDVDVNDIRALQNEVPELLVELSLGDSLEQSFYVKEKLSQTNLSKLCDPKSNPKLVETLRLRELTGNNGMQKMTVSQLHKEISHEDMALDITNNQMNWQLGESTLTIPCGEPSSLKTLMSEFEGLQSSQSSEISDSMFRSAEGLDEKENESMECPGEVVGLLELSEEPNLQQQEAKVFEMLPLPQEKSSQIDISEVSKDALNEPSMSKLQKRHELNTAMSKYEETNESPFSVKFSSSITKQIANNAVQTFGNCRTEFVKLKKELTVFCFEWSKTLEEFKQYFTVLIANLYAAMTEESNRIRALESRLEAEIDSYNEIVKKLNNEFEEKEKMVEYEHNKKLNELEIKLKTNFEDRNKKEIEELQLKINVVENKAEKEKLDSVADLNSALELSKIEILKLNEENSILNEKIESLERDWEKKETQHKEEICKIGLEKQDMHNLNKEMKEEILSLRSSKSLLESENQQHFNSALKKVKKEKEKSMRELQMVINDLKNEIETKVKVVEKINAENEHYKEVNLKIMSRIEALEKDKEKLEMLLNDSKKDVLKLQSESENERINHDAKLERFKNEMVDSFEKDKIHLIEKFEAEKAKLKGECTMEKIKLIEDFKKQRTNLKEEAEKEKLEMKENLKREKAALVLSFEVEKQKYTEEFEKQQSLSKTSSIEEGIDALEWEKVLQNLRDLEVENELLKSEKKLREEVSSQNHIEIVQKASDELRIENESLKEKLKKLHVFMSDAAQSNEDISFHKFNVNDLVILCYDEQRSNYMVLTIEDTKYFLHPDSKPALNLTEENPKTSEWMLAYITDLEYCVAKKAQNRFKLPVGSYLYRIQAKPWTP